MSSEHIVAYRNDMLLLTLVVIDALLPGCAPDLKPIISPSTPTKEDFPLVSTVAPTETQSSFEKAVSIDGSVLFVHQQSGRTLLFEHKGPLGIQITIDGKIILLSPAEFDNCDLEYCPLLGGAVEPELRKIPILVLKTKNIEDKKSQTIFLRGSPDWRPVQLPGPTPKFAATSRITTPLPIR